MTHPTMSMLDQAELFQLATNASAANDSASSIAYLKEAVSRPDATALAHYMLGAEYAQIKMYDRAVNEMEAALALDPALSIARLQLGLLWLTSGVADRAQTVLAPLAELPDSDALRHFGAGLCHLIKDEFDDTVARLERGIVLNTVNAPLNGDMRMLLDEIARVRAAGNTGAPAVQQPEAKTETEAQDSRHVLLSAYTSGTSH